MRRTVLNNYTSGGTAVARSLDDDDTRLTVFALAALGLVVILQIAQPLTAGARQPRLFAIHAWTRKMHAAATTQLSSRQAESLCKKMETMSELGRDTNSLLAGPAISDG